VSFDAFRDGCAVWVDADSDLVEMVGEDRHRFLNGLITADVIELPPGAGCYGLFTTIKGRILADVVVVALPDRIWLRLPPGRGAAVVEHAERYIITDRVELRPLSDFVCVLLGGPAVADRLCDWLEEGAPPQAAGENATLRVHGVSARIVREPRDPAAYSIWLPSAEADSLLTDLLEGAQAPRLVDDQAVDTARVEAGIPRFGEDFDEETFPQEADLDLAVSYEKGCYLGQEVVARIHFRGGVNRVLRGLELESVAGLSRGDRLLMDGEAVGHVTSTGGVGSLRALGMIAVAAAGGERLELENGTPVRLVRLPFATD
jgi:folate-binding protein YgfZ